MVFCFEEGGSNLLQVPHIRAASGHSSFCHRPLAAD